MDSCSQLMESHAAVVYRDIIKDKFFSTLRWISPVRQWGYDYFYMSECPSD